MRSARSYTCRIDAATCRLVDSAAYEATARGFVTVRDDESPYALQFIAPPDGVRTVFFTAVVPAFNHLPMVSPDLIPHGPAAVEQHGRDVYVRAIPGGVELRDGELVSLIADNIFGGGR